MNVNDAVEFVKKPPGNTSIERNRVPLGQCGVITQKGDGEDPLYRVDFGRVGEYWLAADNIKPIPGVLVDLETYSKVPLPQTPLAASVERDTSNETVLRHSPLYVSRQLAMLALDVALGCPLDRPNQPGYYAYVSRVTVRAIRATLDDAGIDWKKQHKEIRRK